MEFKPVPNPDVFYQQVWQLVRQVPYGRVATYGQIAQLLDVPEGVTPEEYATFGSRWVGNAMAASPADVPWQRVINSQGKISQRRGAAQQRQLLEAEGIVFKKDRIDLKQYQWRGEDESDVPRQPRLF